MSAAGRWITSNCIFTLWSVLVLLEMSVHLKGSIYIVLIYIVQVRLALPVLP